VPYYDYALDIILDIETPQVQILKSQLATRITMYHDYEDDFWEVSSGWATQWRVEEQIFQKSVYY